MLRNLFGVIALAVMLGLAGSAVATEDTTKIVFNDTTMDVYYSSYQTPTGGLVYDPESVLNEVGLSGDDMDPVHSKAYSPGNWNTMATGALNPYDPANLPRSTTDFPVYFGIDFGLEYELDELWVWNCNMQYNHSNRGLQWVYIDYGVDDGMGGITWTELGEYQFAKATESDAYTHNTTIDFGGVIAQYVMISTRVWDHATKPGTYGEATSGLSELRFHGTAIPEPATMLLAGLGAFALLLRRRKR